MPRKAKPVDIYVAQVDSHGYIDYMYRVDRGGFIYYAPRRIRLRVNNGIEYRVPRGIKEARGLRRKWIAGKKSEGLKIKGVRSIDKKMHHELNADRFSDPVPITDYESLARTYKTNKGFILLEKHKLMVWNQVFGEEFGFVTFGVIERAIGRNTIFEVFPRKDAAPL